MAQKNAPTNAVSNDVFQFFEIEKTKEYNESGTRLKKNCPNSGRACSGATPLTSTSQAAML
jgi:hypothetical protein